MAGQWLAANGVVFTEGRGLVRGSLINWTVILLAIVWFAPNTQQIMARFEPALGVPRDSAPAPRWLLWRPTPLLGMLTAALAFTVIIHLHQRSEFLYFQF